MFSENQYVTVSALYLLCFQLISTNSRFSNLWRLSTDETKIVDANPFPPVVSMAETVVADDDVFSIITSTIHRGKSWIKQDMEYFCTNCRTISPENIRM